MVGINRTTQHKNIDKGKGNNIKTVNVKPARIQMSKRHKFLRVRVET